MQLSILVESYIFSPQLLRNVKKSINIYKKSLNT